MNEREETKSASEAATGSEPNGGAAGGAMDLRAGARASWGFPRFAEHFPRHPDLDALVAAFARGDYRTVREGAPKLMASTTDEDVKRAAEMLRERIEPDRAAKMLFLFAAALLVVLTAWWVTHDGPGADAPPAPKTERNE